MDSSLEMAVLEQVLCDFRQGFQSQVPLKLRHPTDFFDASKILELAKAAKTSAYKQLLESLSKLDNSENKNVKATLDQFGPRIQDIIGNDFIAKHEGFKQEAETFMRDRVDSLFMDSKTAIERKVHPQMEETSLEQLLEDERQRAIDNLDHYWSHVNVTLLRTQKRRLEKKFDELKEEMQEKHRQRLETETLEGFGQLRMPEVVQMPDKMEATSSQAEAVASGGGMQSQLEPGRKRRRLEQKFMFAHTSSQFPTFLKGEPTSNDSVSRGENDSLIFVLHQDTIEMSILINGSYQCQRTHAECSTNLCDNDNIEWLIPSYLGVDEQGQLKCDEGEYAFSLRELLQATSPSESKKISFNLGREKLTQEVNIEFLLGVLLKIQKESAQSGLKKKLGTAIIMVPMWVTSFQRHQLKDSAVVAGFDKVHLLDEESTTAYNYALEKLHKTKCIILVLGYKFKIMSAMLYVWNGVNLTLKADSHFDVKGLHIYLPRRTFYSWINEFLSVELQPNGNGTTRKALLLPNLPSAETLADFLSKFGFEYDHVVQDECGASILEKKSVDEIHKAIWKYSPGIISYIGYSNGHHDGTSRLIQVKKWMTPLLGCRLSISHFQSEDKLEICQDYPRQAQGEQEAFKSTFGQLEFRGDKQTLLRELLHLKGLELALKISFEGIVALDVGSLELIQRKSSEETLELSVNDFAWSTPNLDEEERGRITEIVHSIMQNSNITLNTSF